VSQYSRKNCKEYGVQNDAIKPATLTIHQGRQRTAGIGREAAGTRNSRLSSLPLDQQKN
jgi:hypothetical protein